MKQNRMFHLLQILIFVRALTLSNFAHAQDSEIRPNFLGSRALGMGGAQIAVVNDETALLANPAALGKLRDFYGTILDPEIDLGKNVNEMNKPSTISNPFDLEQVRNAANGTRDTYYHARGQVFPSMVMKNFGIGFFGRRVLDARMDTAGTALKTFYQDDVAIHLGFNIRLFDGRLKLGLMGKGISRIEINKTLNPLNSMGLDQNASEGFGVGSDAGLIFAVPIVWIPTFSVVARDIGGTAFTAGSGLRMKSTTGEPPAPMAQDFDVAVAVFPIHGNKSRSSFTLEYDKISAAASAQDKSRYYHAGYEFNYADAFFVRAGMNQRYWTAGVEFASEHTQIQLTSYGADVGPDGTPEEDRRYVLKFAIRF